MTSSSGPHDSSVGSVMLTSPRKSRLSPTYFGAFATSFSKSRRVKKSAMKIGNWNSDRQARGGRVDLVLPVELHQLLVLPLPVVLPALLDLLHLRRVRLEVLHRVDLAHRDRHEQDPHARRRARRSTRPRGRPDRVVEPLEDGREDVLERRQDPADDHRSAPRRRKSVWSRTWSTPPCDHGLQRRSRQPGQHGATHQAVLA